MKNTFRLGFIPTPIICNRAFIAYKIFRTPELDRQVEKFAEKEARRAGVQAIFMN